mmetsp:Transcript_16628/g.28345  ORF Transcript_16628/g.28345 Transcript_16628/m.28345 type:complete len:91 (-) Transcript_16628:588-860(-)|eukprot:CAMPEP_0168618208 /NCGR_PEP_ID=MMETSP0449_2-20121227/5952_1 /TAXON_ID=1082188 /ORGANISM="Strombidium rassoulzadegani, Strain ras09" /LENGTH=90 /DNA_ID=CAMNT_0008659073 /DNA_START=365 /DNA_END=637 /DNA_ORIENTATION=+
MTYMFHKSSKAFMDDLTLNLGEEKKDLLANVSMKNFSFDFPITYTRLTKANSVDDFKQGIGQGKNMTGENYKNFTFNRANMMKSKYLNFI